MNLRDASQSVGPDLPDPDCLTRAQWVTLTAAAAKAVCAGCAVKAECLEDALDRMERFGVFGGMVDCERRQLRRTRGQAAS